MSLVKSLPRKAAPVFKPQFYTPRLRYTYSTKTSNASTLKVSSVPAPHHGSIRILSLNRPSSRNAISVQLLQELRSQVQDIESEKEDGHTRALVLASEVDSAFCAGADLKERLDMSAEQTKDFLTMLRDTFTRISLLRIPTFTAISGGAFGGGLELALTTTFRVFGSTCQVALPETRLAIIPGAGGTFRLPALIGTAHARDLILTGRRVGGGEAYFLGLCDRLVEVTEEDQKKEGAARAKVLMATVGLARDVCEGGPVAVRAALEAVNSWGAGEEAENEAYEKVLGTEDRIEALRAFGEKRAPVFRGR